MQRDGFEGYGGGVVVVGILAGDGVEEVGSIFDSTGHGADGAFDSISVISLAM